MKTYFLHPKSIRKLFDNIAPTYDFLNHLLSLGIDSYWRKMAIKELKGHEGQILDIATGTGDIAIEIAQQNGLKRKVFGLDFSEPMIRRAQQKLLKKKLTQSIVLSLGDALSLPFRDNTFNASMIAFGLRNIVEKENALSEMVRVIKEGGKIVVLEFTLPQSGILKMLYTLYIKKILPWIGGLISGNMGAYAYLPESICHFRYAENYAELMRKVGLQQVSYRLLAGGIVSIISGVKKCK